MKGKLHMDHTKLSIGNSSKLGTLAHYIMLGWALVPLHDVSAGACSCVAGPACSSAGKHPRFKGWQEEGHLVREVEALRRAHEAAPRWNWGLATGAVSGVWALDWDPGSATDEARDLWASLLVDNASTPTRTHRTGSGGEHLIFALPPDFEPRGSQGRGRNGLPVGLDVRGWHGQIVLPPSVTSRGAYTVIHDAPPRRAASWLEGKLRAGQTPPAPAPTPTVTEPIAGVGAGPDDRGALYARRGLTALLAELAHAAPGSRNDAAFRTACRIIELCNAPWSGLDVERERRAWEDAGMAMAGDGYGSIAELDGVWRRALDRAADTVATLPPERELPTWLRGEIVPFVATPPVESSGLGGDDPFSDPGVGRINGHRFDEYPETGQTAGVTEGVSRAYQGRITAGQTRDTTDAQDPFQDAVAALVSRMLTPERLRRMPPPKPLINGVLDLDTTSWLIGAPGSYKSFVALDLAAHVALGRPWRGRATHQGLVLYVAAEGARGMRLRVDAWEREYGELAHLLVLPEPVQADERRATVDGAPPGWTVLVEAVRRLRPALIVLDTQARVTIGLEENSNSEMSYYAEQAARLKRACGACVLTVHHTGRAGDNARGASALDGAQDAELRVEKVCALRAVLHMDKQKDQAESPAMAMDLRVSAGGLDPDTGRDLSSLVIAEARPSDALRDPGAPMDKGRARMIALYELIRDSFGAGEGGTRAEIRAMFLDLPDVATLSPAVRRQAWARAWNGDSRLPGLVPRGLIAKRAGGERFKVIVLSDDTNQAPEGALTPNARDGGEPAPAGWNVHWPDDESDHFKTSFPISRV